MAKLSYGTDSKTRPEPILRAAVNFTESRPDYWPSISRKFYRVHELGDCCAEVTEGSDVMGGMWARERYDWTTPGVVRATIQDSNIFKKGGVWELRAVPNGSGGTRIEVLNHRQAKGLRGHVIGAMLQLSGRKMLTESLAQTVDIVERDELQKVDLK
jgi:hypothetical protein